MSNRVVGRSQRIYLQTPENGTLLLGLQVSHRDPFLKPILFLISARILMNFVMSVFSFRISLITTTIQKSVLYKAMRFMSWLMVMAPAVMKGMNCVR